MFGDIKVKNFRGVRSSEITGLGHVNLFWGKNNCGKSTLLDSLFLISGLSNPQLPLSVNFFRDYIRVREKDLSLNFYGLDTSSPIEISTINEHVRSLVISLISSVNVGVEIDSNNLGASDNLIQKKFGYRLDYTYDGRSYYSELIFNSSNEKATQRTDDEYSESLHCKYLTPKFKLVTSAVALKEMFENKDEQFLLDTLRIISPELRDVQLSEDAVLVDIGHEKRIPINLMGDGIRKLLSIIVGIYECRSGVLLIDEIDNGLHYSVMSKVWEAIIKAAEDNNTQIFATTHSLDSLKGFNEAVQVNHCNESVAAFKLLHTNDGELRAFKYPQDQLDYAIKQEIEIR